MGQKTNTIEINGKKYDARTGDLLHAPAGAAPVMVAEHKPARQIHDVARQPAKPAVRHAAQRSKTLVRHAVAKPASAKKIKVAGHTDALARQQAAKITVKKPARSLDAGKARRAGSVAKSNLITHFVPVTAMPGPSFQAPSLSLPAQPLLNRPARAPRQPKASAKPRTTSELLDLAIQHANSHEQAPVEHKPRHKRRLKSAALSATALLLFAFVGWQELPDARLQLASAKAGFNVSQPAYAPSGFSLSGMKYSQGSAALSFQSNSDERRYSLVEKASDWNSQALLDNFVLPRGGEYQAAEGGGITVYLYGNGNATWVNGGVWYVVQGDGALSQRQLLDIAAST